MSDYTKTADYAAKDSLPTGHLQKVVRGTELGADFDAIAIAIATKYDSTDLGVTLQGYHADTVTLPSGTAMLFQQTSAPTGWTKVTTYNDASLRVVSGSASSGGADAFSTLFGTSKSTASYTLTTTDIPAHNHGVTDPGHVHGGVPSLGAFNVPGGGSASYSVTGTTNSSSNTTGLTTNNAGGGGGHAHTLNNMNLKYVDCIIATKN